MLINILVMSITAIVLVFVAVWSLAPALRSSIEAPKYPVAEWDKDRKLEA
jgi:succinate dehydrogenase hydrophobic anchor subunit